MGKLIVKLSDELHEELRKTAVANRRSFKDIVTALIVSYLSHPTHGGSRRKVEETVFCGSWEDERTAEEIVADIRAERRWFQERRI
ncbi:hypothetical protein HKBW3S03_00126 [Candidatus Hakubella thermalkaliphila]|uniref:Ribbon-helix-helix protein CopG domain-containing protein n=1 Tax=Candidatus Hakubella thermalkaliphila TaxID=2754717 RepID=A0A6V8PC80_9ACTN|nr:hypothetical protein [Candidatus Hakubella thermalkaliphila]GFP18621.1 hypothetical protein HKBW3S03_00126 [Candidatus Hakubella thermalkaliphila]GFP29888.1 hypothetical protein HKBW3S34_00808 [Candidatus Hakubella thermalkaliphila]